MSRGLYAVLIVAGCSKPVVFHGEKTLVIVGKPPVASAPAPAPQKLSERPAADPAVRP